MNLDDSNDIFPSTHHKEARNGVFKGNAPDMHFTAIRGNSMVTNSSLIKNDCNIFGNITFTPNCALVGTAALTTAVNFNILSVCDGIYQDVTINSITGGDSNYQASTTTYDIGAEVYGIKNEIVSGLEDDLYLAISNQTYNLASENNSNIQELARKIKF